MSSTKSGFSAIDLAVCWQIITSGGGFNELAAFVVLVSHTSGLGSGAHQFSTAGARAVNTKTGISYRKAQKALDWLFDKDFIEKATSDHDVPRARQVRWMVANHNEQLVYLPHSLIHGVSDSGPPLSRIYAESELGPTKLVKNARTDTLWVLLALYGQHSIEDFGGIDPSMLWVDWVEAENDEHAEIFESGGLSFTPFIQTRGASMVASNDLVVTCFGEFTEKTRERFWHSIQQLESFGLFYEVAQCWDADPRKAEGSDILFPLHVFDSYASDPHISNDVNKVVRLHFDYPDQLLYYRADDRRLLFCPSIDSRPVLIGSLRLRYRPSTQDTGVGMERQESMVTGWTKLLNKCLEETKSEIFL